MINIDTWTAGCKVRAIDWIDGKNIYLNIQYFMPGASLSQKPAKELSVLIEKSEDSEYKLRHYLNSIVNHFMFSM